MGIALAIAFGVMLALLTTGNVYIGVFAIISITCTLGVTVGSLILMGWKLNIIESITLSLSVGLSVDFELHYGVAYVLAVDKNDRKSRVLFSMTEMSSAVIMAAFTTFIAGYKRLKACLCCANDDLDHYKMVRKNDSTESSVCLANSTLKSESKSDITSIENSHLVVCGPQLIWKGNIQELKHFTLDVLKLTGNWESPGGDNNAHDDNKANVTRENIDPNEHVLCAAMSLPLPSPTYSEREKDETFVDSYREIEEKLEMVLSRLSKLEKKSQSEKRAQSLLTVTLIETDNRYAALAVEDPITESSLPVENINENNNDPEPTTSHKTRQHRDICT
ncbi:dispatched homolog 1 isoform X1 [Paramuricea clavata]|uniref:Dispatched homolog 1 isoform X1 n=1 Tax=Paramuricea clavata TaxID=317549 RepID=A0A6S7JX54_PARCT|nr:dispatched homolog 1 isoform X1 [Paramuricea clavata]